MNTDSGMWQPFSIGLTYARGEDSVVYFDCESGDTHLLSTTAAYILELVKSTGGSTAAIVKAFADEVENPDALDLHEVVQNTLEQLAQINLVTVV